MPPEPSAKEKDLGRDLKVFERLPAKTKELVILQDQAAKATGPENVALNRKIRGKAGR